MFLYIAIFLVMAGLYFGNADNKSNNNVLWAVLILGLGLFVGLGDMLGGYDRYIYGEVFDGLADMRLAGADIQQSSLFALYHHEWIYCYFNVLLTYITHNRYIFILIITMIIYVNLFCAVRRFAANYPMAVMVFMGLIFFFTFTYLRQMLAASFVWWAYRYLTERNALKYFAVVAVAALFHNSALVMVPVYFLPNRKYPAALVVVMLGVCLAIGVSGVFASLYEAYGEVTQDIRVSAGENAVGSLRVAYLIEATLLAGLILTNYRKYDGASKEQITMLNMALMFCAMLLIFIKSDNGGRMSWHFALGMAMTLTYLATCKRRVTITSLAVIALAGFLYLRVLVAWGEGGYQILYPYKSFLTNGVRTPDNCHDEFEYDHQYDVDKFYR